MVIIMTLVEIHGIDTKYDAYQQETIKELCHFLQSANIERDEIPSNKNNHFTKFTLKVGKNASLPPTRFIYTTLRKIHFTIKILLRKISKDRQN